MARPKPLSDIEITRILTALESPRNQCLFILGCKTGFRISELLSLTVEDVMQYGRLRDKVSVQRKNTKCKIESRTIVLHKEAKAYLQAYITEDMGSKDKLFTFTRMHAWRIIKLAAEKAEVTDQVSPGSMRKTFAKRVYEALGKDLINTQRAMGHKSVASTAYYLHFDQDEVDKAILG